MLKEMKYFALGSGGGFLANLNKETLSQPAQIMTAVNKQKKDLFNTIIRPCCETIITYVIKTVNALDYRHRYLHITPLFA